MSLCYTGSESGGSEAWAVQLDKAQLGLHPQWDRVLLGLQPLTVKVIFALSPSLSLYFFSWS